MNYSDATANQNLFANSFFLISQLRASGFQPEKKHRRQSGGRVHSLHAVGMPTSSVLDVFVLAFSLRYTFKFCGNVCCFCFTVFWSWFVFQWAII